LINLLNELLITRNDDNIPLLVRAENAEANLMLASIVTVPSNGFVFHHRGTEEL
jgi:hypothetical protein